MNIVHQSNEQYHAHDWVGKSMLSVFRKDREEYHRRFVAKIDTSAVQTPAMRLGEALHTAVLEPDRFARQVLRIPAWALTSNGMRTGRRWDEFQLDHDGQLLLTAEEIRLVDEMAKSVMEACGPIFRARGPVEESLYWHDEETRMGLKARLDKHLEVGEFELIPDIKTARDASPPGFGWAMRRYDYVMQAVHYSAAVKRLTDREPVFVFVVVQSTYPIQTVVYPVPAQLLAEEEPKYRATIRELAECYRTGNWTKEQPRQTILETSYGDSDW